MSRYSASIARHASRLGAGKPQPQNLTFEEREEQRRLDAEADGRLFITTRSPEQVRALAEVATAKRSAMHFQQKQ